MEIKVLFPEYICLISTPFFLSCVLRLEGSLIGSMKTVGLIGKGPGDNMYIHRLAVGGTTSLRLENARDGHAFGGEGI
jgi:hypothetical protein